MGPEPFGILLRRLRRLADQSVHGGLADAELLERFVSHRDEAAFEVLIWRHGAMVLGLCRRMLRHDQDAEDAFQATFLTLVRKASSIGKRQALSSWLYKVAYRVALAARARSTKTVPVLAGCDIPSRDGTNEILWRDLRPVLDEEVSRLPEKYRAAFVLCCLEGRTNDEAARALGCPRGTILSRLARARERLRKRLTRRGIGLAVGLGAMVSAEQTTAAVPAGLVYTTLTAALGITAGKSTTAVVSAPVAALTQGVLHAMFMTKLKLSLAVALIIVIAGVGAGVLGNWGPADAAGTPPEDGPQAVKGKRGAGPQDGKRRPDAEDPAQTAARRTKSMNNLKLIALAMHNYHDTYNHFPPPAIYSKNGKALLSWRVALLPFLEQDNLYKQFKLDESWDSPHNKAVAQAMPAIYAPVGALYKQPDKTYYQVFVGTGAVFEGGAGKRRPASRTSGSTGTETSTGGTVSKPPEIELGRGISIPQITDGTSITILVVEAGTPVFWSKPEDLPFVPGQALPKLGGLFNGGFNAAFADGSVHWISKDADPETLSAAITRAGGEIIDFDRLHGGARQPERGRGGAAKLPEENARLRRALENAVAELDKMKEEVAALKDLLAKEIESEDANSRAHRKENAEIRRALEETRTELEALRQEKARLELDLKKRLKNKN
jgi:RNA polymerase sigma factor (sigma-70 family)